MPAPRIYLDNAATSWPKPPGVYDAVDYYQRELGAPAGRGVYRTAVTVDETVRRARQGLARLLGVVDTRQVIFTFNGTDALNLALHGLLRSGDQVVTTAIEHNSVLRPLAFLTEHRGIQVTYVGCDRLGIVSATEFAAAVRPSTRLVVISQASNVTGALQPIAEIGEAARARSALVLLDAAQAVGHLPCSYRELPVDIVAASGHKGLMGPLGTGFLYLRPGVEEGLLPLRQGGTGTASDEDRQPAALPERYESGNHNAPGLFGLAAAADYLQLRGLADLRRHEIELAGRLLDGLRRLPRVTLYGPADPERQVGVVSFNIDGYNPQELATLLDAAYGIQVRSGLHCAPRMHRALGTIAGGGTVRMSVGAFTTLDDVDRAVAAVAEIASAQV